ncbi:hypothetical protein N7472_008000 [Penicillium cf. griseofulvum]|uniref:Uncharacterized protein n=1 Tax=Penicillium cf. griseofulvum TaxID=2972120 RepID=A0A9W9J7C0_9EURO|nr:hypothetical protein N7472_008000 [Penicillium cf. griseofulvum]
MSSWMQNRNGDLSQFVSSFLHGRQYMRCSDIATENRCSQPVECKDATIPAGALVLHGFAGIHQVCNQPIGHPLGFNATFKCARYFSSSAPQFSRLSGMFKPLCRMMLAPSLLPSPLSLLKKQGAKQWQNGYPGMNIDNIVSSFGGEVPSVRTAGFFQLPLCIDGFLTLDKIQKLTIGLGTKNGLKTPPTTPVRIPMNIMQRHVKKGCIVVNGEKRCQTWGGAYNVRDLNKANSTATIYSKFNVDDNTNAKVTPGCKLIAEWPRDWADMYFNNDCLEDRNGYYKLCCDDATVNQDLVTNPYAI